VIAVDGLASALEHPEKHAGMQPLHLARIEDLGRGDLAKLDGAIMLRC
jgi:hypothetical protein